MSELNHTFLQPKAIPEYERFTVDYHSKADTQHRMTFRVNFTVYPNTSTIGVIVEFSRQGSSEKWARRYSSKSDLIRRIFDYHLQNTLLSIVDKFGGALHISGNTAVVKGDRYTILRLYEPHDKSDVDLDLVYAKFTN